MATIFVRFALSISVFFLIDTPVRAASSDTPSIPPQCQRYEREIERYLEIDLLKVSSYSIPRRIQKALSHIASFFFGGSHSPEVGDRYAMAFNLENLSRIITHRSQTLEIHRLTWDDDLRQTLLMDESTILDLKIDALKRMKYDKNFQHSLHDDAYLAESMKGTLPLPELPTSEILARAEALGSFGVSYTDDANSDDKAYVECLVWVVSQLGRNARKQQ